MYNHILSIILFTPLVGGLVLLLIPGETEERNPLGCQHLRFPRLRGFPAAGGLVLGSERPSRFQVRGGGAEHMDSNHWRWILPGN